MFGFPNQQNNAFGWGFQPPTQQKFQQYFRCYPVVMLQGSTRDELNYGGKIIMPPSSLNKLTRLHVSYPMNFELTSDETGMSTHAGVLEFIAPEGHVYLPQWMMDTLAVSPGSLIKITNTSLDLGTFVKIEPQSVDFLEISDPRAVLENAFRSYSTLTKDDVFQIAYNDKIFSIKVLEVKPESPSHAISVIETDLEVDFAPPVGYVEPTPDSRPGSAITKNSSTNNTASNSGTSTPNPLGSMAKSLNYEQVLRKEIAKSQASRFQGSGNRLSSKGKSLKPTDEEKELQQQQEKQAEAETLEKVLTQLPASDAPPLSLPFGQLYFGYPVIPVKPIDVDESEEKSDASSKPTFEGAGKLLRNKKRKGNANTDQGSAVKKSSPSPKNNVIEID